MIDRRSFVRLAVAGIAVGSSVARAQTGTSMRRVGVLSIGPTETEEERRESMIPMRELGWIEGRNLAVERRFANLQVDPLRPYAEELVRLKVEVILTFGTEAAFAAKNATTSIPIVLSSAGDPVGTGLVGTSRCLPISQPTIPRAANARSAVTGQSPASAEAGFGGRAGPPGHQPSALKR